MPTNIDQLTLKWDRVGAVGAWDGRRSATAFNTGFPGDTLRYGACSRGIQNEKIGMVAQMLDQQLEGLANMAAH